MDFRSLLQTMSTLSEGEKTTTEKGTVHKGEYGNKYGKEDVRDQYGHKIGKKDKGAEAKKDAPKKGRGRPKKDTGETGEKFDSSTLASVMGGKKPKKEIGKVSKKHSLKEYMESVEDTKHAETVMEGIFGGVDHTSVAANLSKLARVIKSVQTPEQFAVAQKYARRMSGTIMKHQHDNMGFGSGLKANLGVMRDIKADLAAKAKELGIPFDDVYETQVNEVDPMNFDSDEDYYDAVRNSGRPRMSGDEMLDEIARLKSQLRYTSSGYARDHIQKEIDELEQLYYGDDDLEEAEAITTKPMPGATQIIGPGGQALGTADAQTANTIKQAAAQGKLNLGGQQEVDESKKKPDFLDVDKDGNKKETFKKAVKDKEKVEESISLTESPETLEHIINKFKHEVKVFLRGDELDHDLYEALYDYYFNAGEMPYGTAKGRTGDPYEWVTQRFDSDVHDYVVDEGIEDRIGAVPAPIDTNPATQNPITTPAYVRKAQTFGQPIKQLEGKDMKDMQVESWEKQLQGLLNEGITVSSSQGQEGQPNTVSVTATDGDSDALLSVLRNAGIGGFGAEQEAPQVGYGVAQGGEDEFTGTGTEPQPSPSVVGDDGDMLSMLKKMAGLGGGDTEVVAVSGGDEEGGQDYEDEEGSDDTALQPADGGEEQDSGEESGEEDSDDKEETDEGNAFTGKLKQTPQGGEFKMGDKTYTDKSSIEEGGWDPEQFGSDGSGAGRPGGAGGGDEEESVEEAEETCNECGMYESECGCDHEQVEENFANSANDPAEQELMKLKALLSMGGDMHRIKGSQATGNVQKVTMEATLNDWKKLSGIK